MKAQSRDKDSCHIVFYFFQIPCLNFNHVIVMKDFHNAFACYDRSKLKKSNVKQTTFFYFMQFDLKYIFAKKMCIKRY